jgi:hypothetical protein
MTSTLDLMMPETTHVPTFGRDTAARAAQIDFKYSTRSAFCCSVRFKPNNRS